MTVTADEEPMRADTSLELQGRYWRQFPPEDPLGRAEESLSLGWDDTVFVLVDVYGGIDPGSSGSAELPAYYRGPTAQSKGRILERWVAPALRAARRANLPVVFVTNVLTAGLTSRNEWRNLSLRTCDVDVLTAWREPAMMLEHAPMVAPRDDEPVIGKQHYSGFFETNLDSVLRGRGARNLVMVGFDSRICLAATATEALYRDYRVVVLREAIGTTEYPDTSEARWANELALRYLESCVGYSASAEQFITRCAARAGGELDTDCGDGAPGSVEDA